MREVITQEMMDIVPEVNLTLGYRYFLGNMENYTRALLSTLKSIKAKLPLLQQMIISGEYEGLRIIAQTLRKMLSNIGATDMTEATYRLEEALYNDELKYLEEELSSYVNRLVELSEHLEQLLKLLNTKAPEMNQDMKSFLNYDFTKTKESIKLSSDLLERKII